MKSFTKAIYLFACLTLLLACQSGKRGTVATSASPTDMLHPDQFSDKFEQGIDFIASGTEPFWGLEIDFDRIMRFSTLNGDSISTPAVVGQRMEEANATSYRAETEAGPLQVVVYDRPCTNDMPGGEWPKKVEITLGGKRYNGCGRYLYDYRLHDIWVLESINGEQVERTDFTKGLPQLEFMPAYNKVMGHTGCNAMNGTIKVLGKRIEFGRLSTTRMYCPDGGFEGRYLGSLQLKTHRYTIGQGKLQLQASRDTVYQYRKVD